ncbi:hypothetical protein MUP01_04780 [Candidatus Bathyarchaeota archaeon]|nr:hypothetical protein [Candidatus Bathyarchaeota archaeon]
MNGFVCRNLDLGNTVWLNVSRKFLNFHKFFFAESDKCFPCEFKNEIEHHSHTHSASGNITSSSTATPGHTVANTVGAGCGVVGSTVHLHANGELWSGASHNHVLTINLAAGNIGALPNWQTHVHACSVNTCTNGGAAHSHSSDSYTGDSFCSKTNCRLGPHSHTTTITTANDGAAHTHTVSGNSGNGSGTCVSHTHSISLTVTAGDNHRHAVSGPATGSTACYFGGSHAHSALGSAYSGYATHNHTISGTSGGSSEDPLCNPSTGGILAQVI